MSRHNKYEFEGRDYNILTNKPYNTPLELPVLHKAASHSYLNKIPSNEQCDRSVNIKNCSSVNYDPISKLESSHVTYFDALKVISDSLSKLNASNTILLE